ncbi:MAG: hypothetical protein GX971_07735, partial [Firmicutes bacterium]|nr:hypothetical protein [Bacillota bacterium]
DLREYWEIIVKKRTLIAVVFLVTVLGVTIYSLLATPIYEAFTTVMVRDSGAGGMQSMLFEGMGGMGQNQAQNYIQIMKSRTILEQVLERVQPEELDVRGLEKALTIQPIQGSDVLKISIQSPNPAEAQAIVNTLADVFIGWNTLYQQNDRRTTRIFIEAQLKSAEESLRIAEEKLTAYREQEKVLAPTEETVAKIEQLVKLQASMTEISISREELTERITQVRANLAEQDETLISSTTIAENAFVTEYRSRLADLEVRLSSAREKYTDRHPTVLALQAEIEDVTNKLAEQVERVVGTETRTLNAIHQQLYGVLIELEVESMALQSRQTALASLIEEYESELSELPARELEWARLTRDAKVMEQLYVLLRTKYEEARIAEAMQTADVQVIDDAILPEEPVKPRVKLNIAIGGVLGVFLGVGVAFLLEFMDNTLNTKEEAERLLGVPVLGQIPDNNLLEDMEKKRFPWRKGRDFSA